MKILYFCKKNLFFLPPEPINKIFNFKTLQIILHAVNIFLPNEPGIFFTKIISRIIQSLNVKYDYFKIQLNYYS